MGQKTTNKVTVPDDVGIDLTTRQLQVVDERSGTSKQKTVLQVARKLGVTRQTVYRDLAKIKESEWLKRQVEKMQTVEGLAFANFLTNLTSGKYEAAKDYYKGLGVWQDKLEVSGSIEQKLSDQEITDKAKQVILEVIQEAKGQVKGSEVKQIEGSKREEISQDDK